MKVLFTDYTFNPTAKTITFNTTDIVKLYNVLLITNVTDNIIIYNFANNSLGGTIANNVLTLTYDTSGMSSTDALQIFLDIGGNPASEDTLEQLVEQTILLKRLAKIMESNTIVDTAQRQRIIIDNASLTTTVSGTISALTNVSTISSLSATEFIIIMSRNLYANAIRNKLNFS